MRLQRQKGPRRRGFTLLEVLVALAVLSIALLALHNAFASTVFINASSRGLWEAILYANNELQDWERAPKRGVGLYDGNFEEGHPMAGYRWAVEVSDEQPLPGVTVRRVRYTLEWDVAGTTQSYSAEVYVAPEG